MRPELASRLKKPTPKPEGLEPSYPKPEIKKREGPRPENNYTQKLEMLVQKSAIKEEKPKMIDTKGGEISVQQTREMRAKGGTFEYTKVENFQDGERFTTRKDISCGSIEVVLEEITKLLNCRDKSLEGIDLRGKINFEKPEKFIRFPHHAIHLEKTVDWSGNLKYNIMQYGTKFIGEILVHLNGHNDTEDFGDFNATQPHINLDMPNYPGKGYLKTHLTLKKKV
jgi:hypothetical protein